MSAIKSTAENVFGFLRKGISWAKGGFVRIKRLAVLAVLLGAVVLQILGCSWTGMFGAKLGKEPMLTVYVDEEKRTEKMSFERYIEGVVAAEMDPKWPKEALAAQAILARTFTLERIERTGGVRKIHGTDVCTDPKHFQAYDASRITSSVREAVRATKGEIVTYKGKPIRAWFHSSSGGVTARPEEGLGIPDSVAPYIRNVKDSAGGKESAWSASFAASEVGRALKIAMGFDGSEPKSIEISKKGPSGRAVTLNVDGKDVPAPALRIALGPDKMLSTLIDGIDMKDGKVTIHGRGWGHGVGMSQWGALTMARRGATHEDIINHYYENVRIERRWR
jgi:stage II sporulation protein D